MSYNLQDLLSEKSASFGPDRWEDWLLYLSKHGIRMVITDRLSGYDLENDICVTLNGQAVIDAPRCPHDGFPRTNYLIPREFAFNCLVLGFMP
jgi:hypothetical protein